MSYSIVTKMKSKFSHMVIGGVCLLSGGANATLLDRDNGTVYDTSTNITWMKDANLAASNTFGVSGIRAYGSEKGIMTWSTAMTWVAALNAAAYAGFSDWRLPNTVPGQPIYTPYGSYYDQDYTLTGSDLSTLFYVSLGNSSDRTGYDALQQTGPFLNMRDGYWSKTRDIYGNPWIFSTSHGYQMPTSADSELFAWAVRSGDTIGEVPEPSCISLLLAGVAVAAVAMRRRPPGRA